MSGWKSFRAWTGKRPFVGSVLMILAGPELFFSGQLDLGNIHVQLGIEGLQSTVIPVVLVLLGVLTMAMPQHRIFYGVIGLVLSVYTLVGLNLGGFFLGMLLGTIGGILVVAWMPRKVVAAAHDEPAMDAVAAPTGDDEIADVDFYDVFEDGEPVDAARGDRDAPASDHDSEQEADDDAELATAGTISAPRRAREKALPLGSRR